MNYKLPNLKNIFIITEMNHVVDHSVRFYNTLFRSKKYIFREFFSFIWTMG